MNNEEGASGRGAYSDHLGGWRLESVEPPWWDVRHEALKWRRSRGFAVSTLQAFPDLHRMLVEIERRSPQTYVSS